MLKLYFDNLDSTSPTFIEDLSRYFKLVGQGTKSNVYQFKCDDPEILTEIKEHCRVENGPGFEFNDKVGIKVNVTKNKDKPISLREMYNPDYEKHFETLNRANNYDITPSINHYPIGILHDKNGIAFSFATNFKPGVNMFHSENYREIPLASIPKYINILQQQLDITMTKGEIVPYDVKLFNMIYDWETESIALIDNDMHKTAYYENYSFSDKSKYSRAGFNEEFLSLLLFRNYFSGIPIASLWKLGIPDLEKLHKRELEDIVPFLTVLPKFLGSYVKTEIITIGDFEQAFFEFRNLK